MLPTYGVMLAPKPVGRRANLTVDELIPLLGGTRTGFVRRSPLARRKCDVDAGGFGMRASSCCPIRPSAGVVRSSHWQRAVRHPTIDFLREFAEAGGLMSCSSVSDRLLALADEAIDHAAFADASCSTFINRSAGKGFVRYARHPDRTADSRAEGLSFPVT